MADVVRVSADERWAYLPVGSKAHRHLSQFAADGLAGSNSVEVRLRSDAGPLFWSLVEGQDDCPLFPTGCMTENGIALLPGEELKFGKDDKGEYNEFADLSWLNNPSLKQSGIALSGKNLQEDDIVLTAWPSSQSILPARAIRSGRDFSFETIEPVEEGQRCFVIDEGGAGLITVSMASDGSNSVRSIRPEAIRSWLYSAGTSAPRQGGGRFSIKANGKEFVIDDAQRGRRYVGAFNTASPDDELGFIEMLLERGGLGSVLPNYRLYNK